MSEPEIPAIPGAIDEYSQIFPSKLILDHLDTICASLMVLCVVLLVLLLNWTEPAEFGFICTELKLVLLAFIVGFAICLGRHLQQNEDTAVRSTMGTDVESQELAREFGDRNYGSIGEATLAENL
jgi:hypothetical protein